MATATKTYGNPDVLRTSQVAKVLGCSARTATKLMDSDQIPTFTVPLSTHRRVMIAAFRDYLTTTYAEPQRSMFLDRLARLLTAREAV